MATYCQHAEAGVNLAVRASTLDFALLTRVTDSLGKARICVRASEALTSTDTIIIRSLGSASSDSGSAGWRVGGNGAVASGQKFFAEKVTF